MVDANLNIAQLQQELAVMHQERMQVGTREETRAIRGLLRMWLLNLPHRHAPCTAGLLKESALLVVATVSSSQNKAAHVSRVAR